MEEPKINRIIVCGCGAAGSNTFMHLLYSFPDLEYTLIDDDKVENRNYSVGTQPYTKADLNRPKVQALQRIAKMAKGNVKVKTVKERINSVSQVVDLAQDLDKTLVLDCFDNAKSRNIFLEAPKELHIAHIGFSGSLTGTIEWNESYEALIHDEKDEEIDVCERSIARPFIMGLTSIAAITLAKFITSSQKVNCFYSKNLKLMVFPS